MRFSAAETQSKRENGNAANCRKVTGRSMRAQLAFTLPDEAGEFEAALHGRQALSALWDIDQQCRSILKHGEPSDDVRQLCEELRAMIPGELLDI